MSGVRGGVLLALVAAAVLIVVTHSDWARLAWEPAAFAESDFELHWAAGRALVAGQDPYDARVVQAIGRPTGRPDTPFCAANPLVVRLFGLVGGDLAGGYRAWRDWNLVLLVAAALLLASCLRRAAEALRIGSAVEPAAALAIAIGLIVLDDGTWMAFFYNQTNVVTLLLAAAALRAAQGGRHAAEGVLLALAAAAKTSPALLVLVAALAGRRRTLVAALVTGAALFAVSVAWNGLAVHGSYLEMLSLRLGYAAQVPAGEFNNSLHDWNLSPNGLLSRAAESGGWPLWWARAGAWAVTAVVLVALARRVRRGRSVGGAGAGGSGADAAELMGQYACGVTATFLVSSATWPTHLSLAALPCAWIVVQAWSPSARGALPTLLAVVAAVASALLFLPLGTLSADPHQHLDILLKADACIALFAVCLAWPAVRQRRAPSD